MTAEEVDTLDLEGVEWAVLSACRTGLGKVEAGEGVFGLRRAFHVAGARTVIMSLWAVDDRATRDWMRRLYEARFFQNEDTTSIVMADGYGVYESMSLLGCAFQAGELQGPTRAGVLRTSKRTFRTAERPGFGI